MLKGTRLSLTRLASPFALSLLGALLLDVGCKSPPSANISVQSSSVAVGAVVALLADQSVDNNGEPLSYAWRLPIVPAGSKASVYAPDDVHAWFAPDVAGDYTVELKVSDKDSESVPATTVITAGPCGSNPPSVMGIAATPSQPGIGGAVGLSAMVADADNKAPCTSNQELTYSWSFVSVPPGSTAQLSGNAQLAPSFVPQVAGTYVVGLKVTDSTGMSSQLVTQPIVVSTMPVCGANAPVAQLASGNPQAANCQANNGGGNCTISPTLSGAAPSYSISAVPNMPGRFDIQLDAGASFDPDNQAPCNMNQPQNYKWDVIAAPLDGSWSWQVNGGGGGGGGGTTGSSSLINPTLRLQSPGTYQVRLLISDGSNTSMPVYIQIKTG